MELRLSTIQERFPQLLTERRGADLTIKRIQAVETAGRGDLVFVENRKFVADALARNPTAVVTNAKLADLFPNRDDFAVLISPLVGVAHALIKSEYADRPFDSAIWTKNPHPSAVIHPSASLGSHSFIGPNVSIGANVKLGDHCKVYPGVVIEEGAVIGARCTLHPNSVVGYDCELGNDVIVGAGTIIGSEGYGFAQDPEFKSYRIPQTGKVIIGDRVRLGSNNCIDRASYGTTRIGAGTKTDNLCHFAHGVQIGENCLLTSMFCIAGSSKVGNRVVASGQSGVIDHVEIADDVWLLHRAGVVKDIPTAGKYAALPVQPLDQYKRNMSIFANLEELQNRVKALEDKDKG